MTLRGLLRENVDVDELYVWENEHTPTPVRRFAVQLHSIRLSEREVEGVLAWLVDRFHSFWRGSQASAKRWLRRFRHYYKQNRPSQALDGHTPAAEMLN